MCSVESDLVFLFFSFLFELEMSKIRTLMKNTEEVEDDMKANTRGPN